MNRTTLLLGLAGLAAMVALILHQGAEDIFSALAAGGLGLIWASLFHIVPMALNARAWQVLLPGARPPGLGFFTWLVWVREAVNVMLPVARIGGEIVTARLMFRHGLYRAPAVASLIVDVTVTVITQLMFTLAALGLLISRHTESPVIGQVVLSLVLGGVAVALVLMVQKFGLFRLITRLFEPLMGTAWITQFGSHERFDRAVRHSYRRMGRVLSCGLWQLAGWAAGAGEIWIMLHFLGHPLGIIDALLVEALVQAIGSAAFVVPGAFGVQEGGFLVIGGLVGLDAPTALALALSRRARDLLVFVPALIAWQAVETWGLFRRG